MKQILQNAIALAAAALILTTTASQAQTAYALAEFGTQLIKFELATPGITTVVGTFSGAASTLNGIDFRPADGLLYGYGRLTNRVVTIDLTTALTTLVSSPSPGSTTSLLGIDFNPVADRLRVVNLDDQNLRINVGTGATTVDGTLSYSAGDPNFGANPNIIEAAYTNSDTNSATGTALFYIDSALDTLVSTSNPNGGVLSTVGALGVDTNSLTGFDILSDGIGGNTFYALLTSTSGPGLYTLNSGTGAASLVGAINTTAATPYGLAIVQPVPEPGTLLLLSFGLLGVGLTRSRRKS